jgi:hypothetical protein
MTDIESRLARVETKILDLEEQNVTLWRLHDTHATEFRNEIRALLEKLIDRMDMLPCRSHIQKFNSYDTQFKLIWAFIISVIIGGIVLGFWVHGR